jgi:non-specific protein-tyrosine kinase
VQAEACGYISRVLRRRKQVKAGSGRLITLSDPRSPAAEAYRTLRTNLQFSSPSGALRTLLVTSAGADEGKSVVLCNLAVTIAQAGSRVIVVDADLRRPSIHELLDLANDKGLAAALLSEEAGELPLQQTAIANLQALTAGPLPPNPADLVGSRRMQAVMDRLAAASADLVIFDAPPIGIVADAALLAPKMDGVILVVSAGKTRREAAGRAKAALERASAKILGVVVDNAPPDPSLYRYQKSRGK